MSCNIAAIYSNITNKVLGNCYWDRPAHKAPQQREEAPHAGWGHMHAKFRSARENIFSIPIHFFLDRRFLKNGYSAEFDSEPYPFFRILISVIQYERELFFLNVFNFVGIALTSTVA